LQRLKAVILVGGPGTRLQPLTDATPKSVVPVLNIPFMEHTFAYLKHFGIEDIVLTLNYLPEVIQGYFGDGSRCGVRLSYCLEEEPLGTAGAVKNAESFLDGTFLVLNGDIFTDLNLADMLACHRANKSMATISLYWVEDPVGLGVVETGSGLRVKRFIEKPPPGEAPTSWINSGFYILEPEALRQVPADCHYMFENGLFPRLLDTGAPVYGFQHAGYWMNMGTPELYFRLNCDLLLSETASPLIGDIRTDAIRCGDGVDIHPSAALMAPVVVGDGCRIGKGVSIRGPVVIGRNCHLGEDVSVESAVLWDNIDVGSSARLGHCIVSSDVTIGENQEVIGCVVTPSRTAPLSR
jgi:mannose-1-phosphate guanylyltransferase